MSTARKTAGEFQCRNEAHGDDPRQPAPDVLIRYELETAKRIDFTAKEPQAPVVEQPDELFREMVTMPRVASE